MKTLIVSILAAVGLFLVLAYLGRNPPRHPEQARYIAYSGLGNAVQSRLTEVVARLLEDGVQPDPPLGPHAAESLARVYARVPTPLQAAAQTGQPDIARLLLAAQANPDLQFSGGESALYFAAEAGHADVVVVLLEAGADPTLAGPEGTPAEVAADRGHAAIAQTLSGQPPASG